LAAGGEQ
jgi:hypothetical protein